MGDFGSYVFVAIIKCFFTVADLLVVTCLLMSSLRVTIMSCSMLAHSLWGLRWCT